ncbi:MAG: amidohydrolase family protein [Gammaproteobacteria bacterium]|nr:amidohydrolase family protein [Gammaproteobacteria bacterium]
MFYSCSPRSSTLSVSSGGSSRASASGKRLTVDLHCHVYVPAAEEAVADAFEMETDLLFKFANEATREVNRKQAQAIFDKLTSVETRLADMDNMAIDIQAVSPAPLQYYYALEPDLGRTAAQIINDHIAELVDAHPDRFVGLGTVPMQEPDLAVAELNRAVRELGMRGVEICTSVAGEELSNDRFRKFFAKAEELDTLIFMHPSGFSDGGRLNDHYFINVIGNPLDTTVAVSHLIFGGVLDAYPSLKICVAHGGGFLPAYSGRIDHAHARREDCRRRITEKPTSYLRKLYFDTVVFTEHQLEYLVSLYGSDHIVLGTDYPYDMGMDDPVGFVEGASALSAADKTAIVGGNAARLLGISDQVIAKFTNDRS